MSYLERFVLSSTKANSLNSSQKAYLHTGSCLIGVYCTLYRMICPTSHCWLQEEVKERWWVCWDHWSLCFKMICWTACCILLGSLDLLGKLANTCTQIQLIRILTIDETLFLHKVHGVFIQRTKLVQQAK